MYFFKVLVTNLNWLLFKIVKANLFSLLFCSGDTVNLNLYNSL